MKENLTVELQMELQRYASQKKGVARESSLRLIGIDIQKDFTKIYEILEFCLMNFSDVCFQRKGSLEGTIQVLWNLRAKACRVVLRENFLKSEHLERKGKNGTSWQRAKEQRLVFIHSLVHLQVKPWQSDSTRSSKTGVLDAVLQYPELSSNTDSWIDRGSVSCFSYGVALALVPH